MSIFVLPTAVNCPTAIVIIFFRCLLHCAASASGTLDDNLLAEGTLERDASSVVEAGGADGPPVVHPPSDGSCRSVGPLFLASFLPRGWAQIAALLFMSLVWQNDACCRGTNDGGRKEGEGSRQTADVLREFDDLSEDLRGNALRVSSSFVRSSVSSQEWAEINYVSFLSPLNGLVLSLLA